MVYASQFAEDLDKSKYLGVPNLYVIDNARYKAEVVLKTLETDKQARIYSLISFLSHNFV